MKKLDFNDLKYIAAALPEEVKMYKYAGDFEGEISCIDEWLKRDIPLCQKKRLEFEKLFAEGLMSDYTTDDEKLLVKLKEHFKEADMETVNELVRFGDVDFILRDGKRMYQNGALSNILNMHGAYLNSKFSPEKTSSLNRDEEFEINSRIMKERGSRAFRYEIEHTVYIDGCENMTGKKIRVWLPFPVRCETQSDIRLLYSSHDVKINDKVMGSAYIETEFVPSDRYTVRFSYVNRAVYHEPDMSLTCIEQPDFYTNEQLPHIQFTPFIRMLSQEIVGDEKNALEKARKIYDWITFNVRYSYLRDYLYIDNIPQFVALNRYGDCGAMSLLFITLCRCVGIPAKWQSGNSARPTGMGSHDWCMFYVAPFGWLYCDPSYGVGAVRNNNEAKRLYYFGNLDPFRCVTCNDFQIDFEPSKNYIRMDPYDNQNGEVEFEDLNVFFDKFRYEKKVISGKEIENL